MVLHGQERANGVLWYNFTIRKEKIFFMIQNLRISLNKWNNDILRNGSYYLHNSIIY